MKKYMMMTVCALAFLLTTAQADKKKDTKGKVAVRIDDRVFKDLKEIYGLSSRAELEKLVNKLLKEQLDAEEE